MKVILKDGTVYHHGLLLDFKGGGKVGFTYHDKVKAPPKKENDIERFQYILKTAELDIADLAGVSDYSHDPK